MMVTQGAFDEYSHQKQNALDIQPTNGMAFAPFNAQVVRVDPGETAGSFGACLARRAGWWKVGRTATMSSSRSVTAASAAAVDQASSAGASIPLMSLRYSSAISVRS